MVRRKEILLFLIFCISLMVVVVLFILRDDFRKVKRTDISQIAETRKIYNGHLKNDHEEHDSVTRFGSYNYVCTGSCVCEVFDEERRNIAVASRNHGVKVLVSVVSVHMAHQYAKGQIEGACTQQLSECSVGMISSNLEECTELVHEEETHKEEIYEQYSCRGKCIENPNNEVYDTPVLNVENVEPVMIDCENKGISSTIPVKRNEYPKKRFIEGYLQPYCRENSKIRMTIKEEYPKWKGWFRRKKEMFSFCKGGHYDPRDPEFNPFVFCKKV